MKIDDDELEGDGSLAFQVEKKTVKETVPDEVDPNLVRWDGDDQEDAKKMSIVRKWAITILLSSSALQTTALNTTWNGPSEQIIEKFNSSHEVSVLGVSLFVFCCALGPILIAPLSELYGRRPLYLVSLVLYIVFQLPTAFGQNMATLIVGRALAGLMGSVSLSNVPGTISDIFYTDQLGMPMTTFTACSFLGPCIGPVLGGFIAQNAGFRWVFYVFLIWSGAITIAFLFLVPETYPDILLVKKAKRLRKETGNQELYALWEKREKNVLKTTLQSAARPLILMREPMVTLLCVYSGFLMAIIYLFVVAYPLVFTEVYGFDTQMVGLTFMAQGVGIIIAAFSSHWWNKYYNLRVRRNGGISEPEFRLPQIILGGLLPPIGLFMFAWTVYPSIHFIVPLIGGAIFGAGYYLTFNGVLSYLVQAYNRYSASVIAVNVCIRGVLCAAFPLFGQQMFDRLGFHWALSLLGFLSVIMSPMGLLFYRYGKRIRTHSAYATI